jgi:hypothetical protein
LDSTPDSGQQQVPTANVTPPIAPPSAPPALPPSPAASLPDATKGAFFSGYANPNMNQDKQKQMLALQMVHLKQVWESM